MSTDTRYTVLFSLLDPSFPVSGPQRLIWQWSRVGGASEQVRLLFPIELKSLSDSGGGCNGHVGGGEGEQGKGGRGSKERGRASVL